MSMRFIAFYCISFNSWKTFFSACFQGFSPSVATSTTANTPRATASSGTTNCERRLSGATCSYQPQVLLFQHLLSTWGKKTFDLYGMCIMLVLRLCKDDVCRTPLWASPASELTVWDDTPTDMIACKHQQPTHTCTHTLTRTVFSLSYMQSVTNRPGQLHPFLWQPWWITLPLLALIKDERGDGHTPGAWHGLISLILTSAHTHIQCALIHTQSQASPHCNVETETMCTILKTGIVGIRKKRSVFFITASSLYLH